MSIWIQVVFTIVLGIYSAVLLLFDIFVSQEYARNFFTDIEGPVKFYAINTTLSVFLLWATALIFVVNFLLIKDHNQQKTERNFYLSQVLIFGMLGFDDRFLVHEWFGTKLHIDDSLILLGIGLVQVIILATWGRMFLRKPYIIYLGLGAISFLVMVIVDGLVPDKMAGRLALEDLAKTWGGAFLFLFAWQICIDKINILKKDTLELHGGEN